MICAIDRWGIAEVGGDRVVRLIVGAGGALDLSFCAQEDPAQVSILPSQNAFQAPWALSEWRRARLGKGMSRRLEVFFGMSIVVRGLYFGSLVAQGGCSVGEVL